MKVKRSHPRYLSLSIRERLTRAVSGGIAVPQGLISHGRGEAFDYMIGEKTSSAASRAIMAAAALLLTATRPVVSVNGNVVALVAKDIIALASTIGAPIEVNLFHRTARREHRIARYLVRLGAKRVLGIGRSASTTIGRISSPRRRTDPRGIASADVVLIPLEDGDRAQALEREGRKVIAIDLNPLSRTAKTASVTIVDNIVRAIPALNSALAKMKKMPPLRLEGLVEEYDNHRNLARSIGEIIQYLREHQGD